MGVKALDILEKARVVFVSFSAPGVWGHGQAPVEFNSASPWCLGVCGCPSLVLLTQGMVGGPKMLILAGQLDSPVVLFAESNRRWFNQEMQGGVQCVLQLFLGGFPSSRNRKAFQKVQSSASR